MHLRGNAAIGCTANALAPFCISEEINTSETVDSWILWE